MDLGKELEMGRWKLALIQAVSQALIRPTPSADPEAGEGSRKQSMGGMALLKLAAISWSVGSVLPARRCCLGSLFSAGVWAPLGEDSVCFDQRGQYIRRLRFIECVILRYIRVKVLTNGRWSTRSLAAHGSCDLD